MAKDDYYVIAYQILSYLYQCLKKGDDINEDLLKYDSPLLQINPAYWSYIMHHLSKSGYIEGIVFSPANGCKYPLVLSMKDCMITPEGIEYLCENSMIKKAYNFLKEIKEIVPFNI